MLFKSGNFARPASIVKTEPDVVLDAAMSWQGPFEHVFVKLMPENRRCIEAVCAWIAHDHGLPYPSPRFVRVKKSRLPAGCPWIYGDADDEVIAFGTLAIEGAQQLRKLDSNIVSGQILKWNSLEAAAVFDHLIANDDRSDGNMLMDPRGGLWLIDHARSLGGGGQRMFSTEVFPSIRNFLLDKIARMTLADRMKRKNSLMTACGELAARVSRIPYEGLLVPPSTAMQIDSFLSQRAQRLQAMVFDAVGMPDMYQSDDSVRVVQ
jgi:hypothetical protein